MFADNISTAEKEQHQGNDRCEGIPDVQNPEKEVLGQSENPESFTIGSLAIKEEQEKEVEGVFVSK